MLLTLEGVLSPGEVAAARSLLAGASWGNGLMTAGSQAAQVKNNEQLPEDCPQLPALRDLVLTALGRSALFFAAALPLKILPPFFNRYAGAANTYGFHTDNAMRLVPGTETGKGAVPHAGTCPGSGWGAAYVRADVSATLFLSEPDSYEGGVLTIDDTFGRHGVKLPAGSLVIYPSSSVHAVTPVTGGERLACFMFIQSMVRDAGKRRLLYDMDMALLQLRQSVGEAAPVVQLTGTYHNLLRRWADN